MKHKYVSFPWPSADFTFRTTRIWNFEKSQSSLKIKLFMWLSNGGVDFIRHLAFSHMKWGRSKSMVYVEKFIFRLLLVFLFQNFSSLVVRKVKQTKIGKQGSFQGAVLGVFCVWNCHPDWHFPPNCVEIFTRSVFSFCVMRKNQIC